MTFSKVAHAIPEALGNKNIILTEECDECNSYFGNNIEPQLIENLNVYRSVYGIKGKRGSPTISYSNGKIYRDASGAVISVEKPNRISDNEVVINFANPSKLIPLKLYKALCKITLSTINEEHLKYLGLTLQWLRYDTAPEGALPKVAVNIINSKFTEHPKIVNYIRKTEHGESPHIVSEFRVGGYTYVYIVPFSSADHLDFSDPKNFDSYWDLFIYYQQFEGWGFEDYSSSKEISFNEGIRIKAVEQSGDQHI